MVAAGHLLGIEPGRRDEFGVPVGAEPHVPLAVVDLPVVVATHRDGILQ
jgi:hypothetical protein